MAATSIDKILNSLQDGHLKGKASDELATLVEAVKDTGKAGKLVITIEVKPVQNMMDAVTLTGKHSVTLPKVPEKPWLFFVGDNGELTLNNPKQLEIPMSAVPQDGFKLQGIN